MQNIISRTLRVAKNLPQKTIADMLDMSQANYSDLENGKTKINGLVGQKLADIFDVDPLVFSSEKPMIFNHNVGTQNKGIINTESYIEAEKETMQIMLQKVDSLFIQLQKEREAVNTERKQVLELMGKLMERLG
jgi:transcriptional regulator with XRE-family HTH domain